MRRVSGGIVVVVLAATDERQRFLRSGAFGFATKPVSPEEIAAYDAPFPSSKYKAGARKFPRLVPTTPDDPAATNPDGTPKADPSKPAPPTLRRDPSVQPSPSPQP